VWSFIRSSYIDLTVNNPLVVSFQTKRSVSSFNCTDINLSHRCNHDVHLWPSSTRLNPIFRSLWTNTWAADTFLWRTRFYNEGYWSSKVVSPNHTSFQNLVCWPLPTLKYPLLKKSCLTLIILFQKGESVGLPALQKGSSDLGIYYVAIFGTPLPHLIT
jgi:hypothetical protein